MSSDPIATTARAAAQRLAADYGPHLPGQVEAALYERHGERYIDPVALGGLIVAVATLAWTVYTDLRDRATKPDPETIARAVRVRLDHPATVDVAVRDNIIAIVVDETTRIADEPEGPQP
jgi:hypothetical protein